MSDPMIAFVGRRHRTQQSVGGSTSTAGVRPARPKPVEVASDALRSDENWTSADLQAYVLRKITERFGPQPDHDNAVKMTAIFRRFHATWGADASRIARHAFETQAQPGYWKGAPIKATRFTRGNDEWFAQPLLDALNA